MTTGPAGRTPLGLVAGQGALPLALAEAAGRRGRRVAAVGFRGQTDPGLEARAQVTWLRLGEVRAGLDALGGAGVREAVVAGRVPKAALFAPSGAVEGLRPDGEGRRFLAGLRNRGDAAIHAALVALLAGRGIELLSQAELVPELVGRPGPLGSRDLDASQRADLALGFRAARALAGQGAGQTAVVKDGTVLALEAIDGTDATIRRGGGFAAGACVVKVARTDQDPRFDLPVVGPDTLQVAREARVAALAFEAGRTLVLDPEVTAARADAAGIALVGIPSPEGRPT